MDCRLVIARVYLQALRASNDKAC
ncbi:hypothetical protein SPHINGOR109_51306 [Sphingorhabdus sp. 109]|nr:hypothetical protein SPHINGOR109_51306 [Sphingorhabdus sp. 109]